MQRAVLTLLAGGLMAQAVPLMLGPWLTRLYVPSDFGLYHLFSAVATNIAVVACARYEFALPLARHDEAAEALRTLCRHILALTTLVALLVGLVWAWAVGEVWPLWLPAVVGSLGLVSLATLNATREQRFRRLAVARLVQHGGGASAQVAAGLLHTGAMGLIAAPIVATLGAVAALGWPVPARSSRARWLEAARTHRSFPILNTPHAFLGVLQDTLAVVIVAHSLGPAAAGAWGLALRYLKAPATLVGGAVSQALYPHLAQTGDGQAGCTVAGKALLTRTVMVLFLLAAPLVGGLFWFGPELFVWAFGPDWRSAGELARALSVYIGLHFVASPLGVVSMAWNAQAWALKLSVVGQCMFVSALITGLSLDGLVGAGWAVSAAMLLYFGWYFVRLLTWPVGKMEAGP